MSGPHLNNSQKRSDAFIMEFAQVDTTTMAAVAGAADFSVWALFWKADIIVKTVMIMLVVASIWCWSIIIEKSKVEIEIEPRCHGFRGLGLAAR